MITDETRDKIIEDAIKKNMAITDSKLYEAVYSVAMDVLDKCVEICVDKIETYRIPVGNSRSGELACEWTYNALKEIRDDIKETFGCDDVA